MPRMSMVEAIRDAMDCKMAEDERVVVFGEDVGYFGGVFRCTEGLQRKYGKSRCFDAPINESGIVGVAIGMGAYGLRPVAEIQFADYVYPGYDQIVSEAARLRYRSGGEFFAPDRHPHAVRRRHLRRTDAQPEPGGAVHPRQRPQDRHPVEPLRRQGPADRRDRGRRSGHLPRAEAALQRPVLRPSRPAGRSLGEASAERGAGGALCRAARQGGGAARGQGRHRALLRHDGPCRRGRGRGDRRRRRDHRSAHAASARHRRDRGLGREDRPLRHRARGDADLGLRRRARRAGDGALLLCARGADPARRRLGHALSARRGMGLFPRAGARRAGAVKAMEA